MMKMRMGVGGSLWLATAVGMGEVARRSRPPTLFSGHCILVKVAPSGLCLGDCAWMIGRDGLDLPLSEIRLGRAAGEGEHLNADHPSLGIVVHDNPRRYFF